MVMCINWFCCRKDQQVYGVDYFDTFAPVVSWTTVRILLILSVSLELDTKQVDYTCAFLHTLITKDVMCICLEDSRKNEKFLNYRGHCMGCVNPQETALNI